MEEIMIGPATIALEHSLKMLSSCNVQLIAPAVDAFGLGLHMIPNIDPGGIEDEQESFPVISWSDKYEEEYLVGPQTIKALRKRKRGGDGFALGIVRSMAVPDHLTNLISISIQPSFHPCFVLSEERMTERLSRKIEFPYHGLPSEAPIAP